MPSRSTTHPSFGIPATLPLLAPLALMLAGCAFLSHRPGVDHPTYPEDVAAEEHPPAAIVLSQDIMDREHTSVLDAITHNLPSILVQQTPTCPILAIRQTRGLTELSNPEVYVDGTRAANTCILESLRTPDVAFIEVYPLGVTTRPGYVTSGSGLILLFMRSH